MPKRGGEPGGAAGAAVVVECGQHFAQSAADLATEVALAFIAHFGLTAPREPAAPQPQRRFELLETHVIKSMDFHFIRPVIGFEVFAKGEPIAVNGGDTIVAPCDDCTIFMPSREVIIGKEACYLTRPL